MYTIEDIDVFVMTHNRAEFLKETLDCLMVQSVRPDCVTVFDNESVDDTEAVVRAYADRGVRYVRTTGRDGNFFEMQKRATRPFVVHFHDDNLFHREYLEKVLYVLNSVEGVAGVTGAYQYFEYSADPNYLLRYGSRLLNKVLILSSGAEFAIHKIRSETRPGELIVDNVGALVYKTEFFKKRVPLTDKYGKADDTALALQVLDYGRFVTLSDWNAVFIRQHPQRDVNTDANSLSMEQAINWVGLYLDQLAGVTDESIWLDFIGLLYTQYSYFIKRSVYAQYSTLEFVEHLIERGVLPEACKEAYWKFKSGKTAFASAGEVITSRNARKVERWRMTRKPSSIRFVRKALKYVMPYFVVCLVWKIQDRIRLGR